MPSRIRSLVDPRFPAALARLRESRGMSIRDLARRAHLGKSYLHNLETGGTKPTGEVAAELDGVLQAGGTLTAMVADLPPASSDDTARIAHTIGTPTRLDAATVALLAADLAEQRRLDDSLPAPMLLPTAAVRCRTVHTLAAQARGPHADGLHEVAAEWTQFLGWLHAEARNDSEAVRLLNEATAQADSIDHGPLAAQATNFRGWLERQRRNPRGIIRHFLDAYHTPGANPLQRVGDAIQAAHGYALLGDRVEAVRLLGAASDLTTAAADAAPPVTAYWLSPTFLRLNLGLAYTALDDSVAAADNLRAGLTGLPPEYQDAPWTVEYRTALSALG
ncbi:helix-turn-helix transcriptional regulator [Micromonospora sp. NPDC049081]|uniref:helix-turn-helix domain-containing protein n=1 Tax=Micromonospora sp. NPDC049081 TaxID=3155150 RepID=UPI0033E3AB09